MVNATVFLNEIILFLDDLSAASTKKDALWPWLPMYHTLQRVLHFSTLQAVVFSTEVPQIEA